MYFHDGLKKNWVPPWEFVRLVYCEGPHIKRIYQCITFNGLSHICATEECLLVWTSTNIEQPNNRELKHQTFLVPRTPPRSNFAAWQPLCMSRHSCAAVTGFKTWVLRLKPEVLQREFVIQKYKFFLRNHVFFIRKKQNFTQIFERHFQMNYSATIESQLSFSDKQTKFEVVYQLWWTKCWVCSSKRIPWFTGMESGLR